jgi:hypothetical protein
MTRLLLVHTMGLLCALIRKALQPVHIELGIPLGTCRLVIFNKRRSTIRLEIGIHANALWNFADQVACYWYRVI